MRVHLRFLIAGMLALLVACNRIPEDKTADGRTIVTYWEKWTDFEGEAMQAVVDDFNASQDRIEVRKLTVSEIDRKLMLATAGGNPPDVAGILSHQLNVFAEKGALTPLDRRLERAAIKPSDYIPVYWNLCRHRGYTWALPSTPATLALHWNKKLFREAGLSPEHPPRTIAELDKMAEQLTIVEVVRGGMPVRVRYPKLTQLEKEKKDFKLIQMGYSPSEPGWWNPLWVYWFGGRLWDGDQTITADSPENVEAFRWFQSYPKKYGLNNMQSFGSSFGNFQSPQNPFLSEKVAMVLQGVWMYNFIDRFSPQLDWGAAPFPSVDPEKYPMVTVTECDVLVVPRGAKHPDEAFEFIRYVNTQPAMEKLCRGQRKFSPLAAVGDDFVRTHPNPSIGVFIELAKGPNAQTAPRLSVYNEYSDEMTVAADQIFTLLVTPRQGLGMVRKRVQQKLDRLNRRWKLVESERLKEWSEE